MEIDWRRSVAKPGKRADVLSDMDFYGMERTPEKEEQYWQDHLKKVEEDNQHLAKFPKFSFRENGIDLRIYCQSLDMRQTEIVWRWSAYYSSHGGMINTTGSFSGNASSEKEAKEEATKAYLKIREVKAAIENLRAGFYARWGRPNDYKQI